VRPVTAFEVFERELIASRANARVPTRNITVECDASSGVVPTDRDLVLEGPDLAIERTAQHLEDEHITSTIRTPDGVSPLETGAKASGTNDRERSMDMDIESARTERGTLDDLLNLLEVDPDALREAEFEQTQSILDTLAGKTIRSASIEDTRIVVETTDGNRYFFYGFMGGGG